MKSLKRLFLATVLAGASISLFSCGSNEEKKEEFDQTKLITKYTRDTDSGTRDGFFTGIDFKDAVKDNTKLNDPHEVSGNGGMISAVKADEYGIGYISLSTLAQSGLKGLKYNGVMCSEETVLDSTYKLTRNFNYIRRSDDLDTKSGKIITALLDYMFTTEGKAIIQNKGGIISLTSADKTWDSVKANHTICNEDNSDVTIKIAGSTSVKEITHQLIPAFSKLCGNFKYEFQENGSSDAYKRTQGSEKDGSNKADIAFASRDFKTDEAYAENTAGKMCVDAIVAVVNNKNPYDDTSKEELKSIYSGTVTKWEEVL